MARNRTELDSHTEGLILMVIFTIAWILSSGVFLNNSYFKVVGVIFGIAILYLIDAILKFKRGKKNLSIPPPKSRGKNEKWYFRVVALEVIAIFAVIIILVKTGKEHLIVSSIALIVGIHFLPMAKIFDRKFDYYVGIWTIGVAMVGLSLISTNQFEYKIVNAYVCIACAMATTAYGLKMVKDGNIYIGKHK